MSTTHSGTTAPTTGALISQEAARELLATALFFLRGIEGGHIKCAPYIDFDPNATQLEIKSPAARLRAAIAAATGAQG